MASFRPLGWLLGWCFAMRRPFTICVYAVSYPYIFTDLIESFLTTVSSLIPFRDYSSIQFAFRSFASIVTNRLPMQLRLRCSKVLLDVFDMIREHQEAHNEVVLWRLYASTVTCIQSVCCPPYPSDCEEFVQLIRTRLHWRKLYSAIRAIHYTNPVTQMRTSSSVSDSIVQTLLAIARACLCIVDEDVVVREVLEELGPWTLSQAKCMTTNTLFFLIHFLPPRLVTQSLWVPGLRSLAMALAAQRQPGCLFAATLGFFHLRTAALNHFAECLDWVYGSSRPGGKNPYEYKDLDVRPWLPSIYNVLDVVIHRGTSSPVWSTDRHLVGMLPYGDANNVSTCISQLADLLAFTLDGPAPEEIPEGVDPLELDQLIPVNGARTACGKYAASTFASFASQGSHDGTCETRRTSALAHHKAEKRRKSVTKLSALKDLTKVASSTSTSSSSLSSSALPDGSASYVGSPGSPHRDVGEGATPLVKEVDTFRRYSPDSPIGLFAAFVDKYSTSIDPGMETSYATEAFIMVLEQVLSCLAWMKSHAHSAWRLDLPRRPLPSDAMYPLLGFRAPEIARICTPVLIRGWLMGSISEACSRALASLLELWPVDMAPVIVNTAAAELVNLEKTDSDSGIYLLAELTQGIVSVDASAYSVGHVRLVQLLLDLVWNVLEGGSELTRADAFKAAANLVTAMPVVGPTDRDRSTLHNYMKLRKHRAAQLGITDAVAEADAQSAAEYAKAKEGKMHGVYAGSKVDYGALATAGTGAGSASASGDASSASASAYSSSPSLSTTPPSSSLGSTSSDTSSSTPHSSRSSRRGSFSLEDDAREAAEREKREALEQWDEEMQALADHVARWVVQVFTKAWHLLTTTTTNYTAIRDLILCVFSSATTPLLRELMPIIHDAIVTPLANEYAGVVRSVLGEMTQVRPGILTMLTPSLVRKIVTVSKSLPHDAVATAPTLPQTNTAITSLSTGGQAAVASVASMPSPQDMDEDEEHENVIPQTAPSSTHAGGESDKSKVSSALASFLPSSSSSSSSSDPELTRAPSLQLPVLTRMPSTVSAAWVPVSPAVARLLAPSGAFVNVSTSINTSSSSSGGDEAHAHHHAHAHKAHIEASSTSAPSSSSSSSSLSSSGVSAHPHSHSHSHPHSSSGSGHAVTMMMVPDYLADLQDERLLEPSIVDVDADASFYPDIMSDDVDPAQRDHPLTVGGYVTTSLSLKELKYYVNILSALTSYSGRCALAYTGLMLTVAKLLEQHSDRGTRPLVTLCMIPTVSSVACAYPAEYSATKPSRRLRADPLYLRQLERVTGEDLSALLFDLDDDATNGPPCTLWRHWTQWGRRIDADSQPWMTRRRHWGTQANLPLEQLLGVSPPSSSSSSSSSSSCSSSSSSAETCLPPRLQSVQHQQEADLDWGKTLPAFTTVPGVEIPRCVTIHGLTWYYPSSTALLSVTRIMEVSFGESLLAVDAWMTRAALARISAKTTASSGFSSFGSLMSPLPSMTPGSASASASFSAFTPRGTPTAGGVPGQGTWWAGWQDDYKVSMVRYGNFVKLTDQCLGPVSHTWRPPAGSKEEETVRSNLSAFVCMSDKLPRHVQQFKLQRGWFRPILPLPPCLRAIARGMAERGEVPADVTSLTPRDVALAFSTRATLLVPMVVQEKQAPASVQQALFDVSAALIDFMTETPAAAPPRLFGEVGYSSFTYRNMGVLRNIARANGLRSSALSYFRLRVGPAATASSSPARLRMQAISYTANTQSRMICSLHDLSVYSSAAFSAILSRVPIALFVAAMRADDSNNRDMIAIAENACGNSPLFAPQLLALAQRIVRMPSPALKYAFEKSLRAQSNPLPSPTVAMMSGNVLAGTPTAHAGVGAGAGAGADMATGSSMPVSVSTSSGAGAGAGKTGASMYPFVVTHAAASSGPSSHVMLANVVPGGMRTDLDGDGGEGAEEERDDRITMLSEVDTCVPATTESNIQSAHVTSDHLLLLSLENLFHNEVYASPETPVPPIFSLGQQQQERYLLHNAIAFLSRISFATTSVASSAFTLATYGPQHAHVSIQSLIDQALETLLCQFTSFCLAVPKTDFPSGTPRKVRHRTLRMLAATWLRSWRYLREIFDVLIGSMPALHPSAAPALVGGPHEVELQARATKLAEKGVNPAPAPPVYAVSASASRYASLRAALMGMFLPFKRVTPVFEGLIEDEENEEEEDEDVIEESECNLLFFAETLLPSLFGKDNRCRSLASCTVPGRVPSLKVLKDAIETERAMLNDLPRRFLVSALSTFVPTQYLCSVAGGVVRPIPQAHVLAWSGPSIRRSLLSSVSKVLSGQALARTVAMGNYHASPYVPFGRLWSGDAQPLFPDVPLHRPKPTMSPKYDNNVPPTHDLTGGRDGLLDPWDTQTLLQLHAYLDSPLVTPDTNVPAAAASSQLSTSTGSVTKAASDAGASDATTGASAGKDAILGAAAEEPVVVGSYAEKQASPPSILQEILAHTLRSRKVTDTAAPEGDDVAATNVEHVLADLITFRRGTSKFFQYLPPYGHETAYLNFFMGLVRLLPLLVVTPAAVAMNCSDVGESGGAFTPIVNSNDAAIATTIDTASSSSIPAPELGAASASPTSPTLRSTFVPRPSTTGTASKFLLQCLATMSEQDQESARDMTNAIIIASRDPHWLKDFYGPDCTVKPSDVVAEVLFNPLLASLSAAGPRFAEILRDSISWIAEVTVPTVYDMRRVICGMLELALQVSAEYAPIIVRSMQGESLYEEVEVVEEDVMGMMDAQQQQKYEQYLQQQQYEEYLQQQQQQQHDDEQATSTMVDEAVGEASHHHPQHPQALHSATAAGSGSGSAPVPGVAAGAPIAGPEEEEEDFEDYQDTGLGGAAGAGGRGEEDILPPPKLQRQASYSAAFFGFNKFKDVLAFVRALAPHIHKKPLLAQQENAPMLLKMKRLSLLAYSVRSLVLTHACAESFQMQGSDAVAEGVLDPSDVIPFELFKAIGKVIPHILASIPLEEAQHSDISPFVMAYDMDQIILRAEPHPDPVIRVRVAYVATPSTIFPVLSTEAEVIAASGLGGVAPLNTLTQQQLQQLQQTEVNGKGATSTNGGIDVEGGVDRASQLSPTTTATAATAVSMATSPLPGMPSGGYFAGASTSSSSSSSTSSSSSSSTTLTLHASNPLVYAPSIQVPRYCGSWVTDNYMRGLMSILLDSLSVCPIVRRIYGSSSIPTQSATANSAVAAVAAVSSIGSALVPTSFATTPPVSAPFSSDDSSRASAGATGDAGANTPSTAISGASSLSSPSLAGAPSSSSSSSSLSTPDVADSSPSASLASSSSSASSSAAAPAVTNGDVAVVSWEMGVKERRLFVLAISLLLERGANQPSTLSLLPYLMIVAASPVLQEVHNAATSIIQGLMYIPHTDIGEPIYNEEAVRAAESTGICCFSKGFATPYNIPPTDAGVLTAPILVFPLTLLRVLSSRNIAMTDIVTYPAMLYMCNQATALHHTWSDDPVALVKYIMKVARAGHHGLPPALEWAATPSPSPTSTSSAAAAGDADSDVNGGGAAGGGGGSAAAVAVAVPTIASESYLDNVEAIACSFAKPSKKTGKPLLPPVISLLLGAVLAALRLPSHNAQACAVPMLIACLRYLIMPAMRYPVISVECDALAHIDPEGNSDVVERAQSVGTGYVPSPAYRRLTKLLNAWAGAPVTKADSPLRRASSYAGVLGLCTLVKFHKGDLPPHVPPILVTLAKHANGPDNIGTMVQQLFGSFKLSHRDAWDNFFSRWMTTEELTAYNEVIYVPSYIA